jgi:hypothetical protein
MVISDQKKNQIYSSDKISSEDERRREFKQDEN